MATENNSKPVKKSLLPIIIASGSVGILVGVLGLWVYKQYSGQITNIVLFLLLALFVFALLTIVLFWMLKNYLTRLAFGSNSANAPDLIAEGQKFSKALINNFIDNLPQNVYQGDRGLAKNLAHSLSNLLIWGRLRNWWWNWLMSIFVAIGGLAGTLLLVNQNELLQNQNILIKSQNHFFEVQYLDTKIKEYTEIIHAVERSPSEREFAARRLLSAIQEERSKVSETQRTLNFIRAHLHEIDLRGLNLFDINFTETNLYSSNLSNEKITKCIFKKAGLAETNITGTIFKECNFQEAYFGTYLNPKIREEGLQIRYPNYAMNTLHGKEKFVDCTFVDCNLNNWVINFCDLRGANFSNCNWDMESIKPETVYAAIFLETKGLSKEFLTYLSKNRAITCREDIIYHINEANIYRSKLLLENDLSSIVQEIDLAIKFYSDLLNKTVK